VEGKHNTHYAYQNIVNQLNEIDLKRFELESNNDDKSTAWKDRNHRFPCREVSGRRWGLEINIKSGNRSIYSLCFSI
jgi:hypothetical protein